MSAIPFAYVPISSGQWSLTLAKPLSVPIFYTRFQKTLLWGILFCITNTSILGFIPISSIGINKYNWIPRTVGIRTNTRVLVRHRVNTQPHGHQLVVHVAGPEVAIPRFLVFLFPGERWRVEPHGLSAVWQAGFMWCLIQISTICCGRCRSSLLDTFNFINSFVWGYFIFPINIWRQGENQCPGTMLL